jgi:hypothetical protein
MGGTRIQGGVSAVLVAAAVALGGCNALIGDDCTTNIECSEDGDRICDRTQPGGYCTILDCEPNTCPKEGVCVQFFDGVHARNYCMRQCKKDADCGRDRYECVEPVPDLSTILDDPFPHKGYCAPRTD